MNEWVPIVDNEGCTGKFRRTELASADVEVSLDSGKLISVARNNIEETAGDYQCKQSFASAPSRSETNKNEVVLPVVQEELDVSKRTVLREHVRLTKTVTQEEQQVDVPLFEEHIEIERVPVERVVEAPSPPRQEGDTWIVPVYEEVVVVEKRLLLREEVHVKRSRRETHKPQSVTLRREDIEVARSDPNDTNAAREAGGQP